MANSELTASVEAFAQEIGAVIWDGIPVGGSSVVWLGADAPAFLEKIRGLAPTVVYVSRDRDVIAVAIAGVIHVFDSERGEFNSETGNQGALVLNIDYDDFDDDDDQLSPELENLAERIATDDRFDGDNADDLIDELGVEIDINLYTRIASAAHRKFEDGIGGQLEKQSRGIVRELIKHPDFDPLAVDFRDDEGHPYIDDAVDGKDPRLKNMIQDGLREAAWQNGRYESAVREVKEQAAQLLGTIPRMVLDQVGFASRNATRDALLGPFLDSVVERRRDLTGYWIKSLDGERGSGRRREARYAAAAQRLVAGGATKTAVAAKLLLSPSTFNRLLSIRVAGDFKFDDDDPIVVELAPELRR